MRPPDGWGSTTVSCVTDPLWTQRLYVPWDVSVSFYQRRWDVLERFESAGLLHDHRVIDNRIAMRIGDTYHLVSFGDDYFDASLLRPDTDASRIRDALTILFEILQPSSLLRASFDFQWLSGLKRSYDDARASSAAGAFGDAGTTVADWAVNIDGKLDSLSATYRAEFGIVSAVEAPPRLARAMSTFVAAPDPEVPPTIWPPGTLPEVAWFFDSRCRLTERITEPSVDALFDLWSRARLPMSEVQASFKASFNLGAHDE